MTEEHVEKRTRVYGEGRRLKGETVETTTIRRPLPALAQQGEDELWQSLAWMLCCVALVLLALPLFFAWGRPDYSCHDWDDCYYYDGEEDYGAYAAGAPAGAKGACESAFAKAVERRRAEHRAAASKAWNETRAKHASGAFYASCVQRRSRDRSTEWDALYKDVSIAAMMRLRVPLPFYAVRRSNDTVAIVRSQRRLCDNELRCEGSLEFYRSLFAGSMVDPAAVLAVEQYGLGYDSDPARMTAAEAGARLGGALDLGDAKHVEFERGALHASAGLFSRFSRSELRAYLLASFRLYSYDRSDLDCAALAMLLQPRDANESTFLDNVLAARRALAGTATSRPLPPPIIEARAGGQSDADQCALYPATCAREMSDKCRKQ